MIEIDGREAGIFQVLEAKALGLHAIMLDRGPLWFDGYGSDDHFAAFTAAYARQFPRRLGRRRRFIPEAPDTPRTRVALEASGFKQHGDAGYETYWLDLQPGEEALRAALKKNWRGALSKAERSGLQVEWHQDARHLPWLLREYALDQRIKKYEGPSARMLAALARYFAPAGNMLLGKAVLDNRPAAGILLLCHGQSATYQIGWSSEEGRDTSAHHLLLWNALAQLRKKGITGFDLGGVNDSTAAGVKKFKQGMGGTLLRLPGLYT